MVISRGETEVLLVFTFALHVSYMPFSLQDWTQFSGDPVDVQGILLDHYRTYYSVPVFLFFTTNQSAFACSKPV